MSQPAFAQPASTLPGGVSAVFEFILPFALILGIMYFFLIRPQQKQTQRHREIIQSIKRGDTIVLNSGLVGKVFKVTEGGDLEVEIADNVRVKVVQSMIATVRNKTASS